MNTPTTQTNDPAKAGDSASTVQIFGHSSRWAVEAFHTKRAQVSWVVFDAEYAETKDTPKGLENVRFPVNQGDDFAETVAPYLKMEAQHQPTKTILSAGWNRPGFLPESDPLRTTSFETAKQYIVEAILAAADEAAQSEQLEKAKPTLATGGQTQDMSDELGPLSDALQTIAEDVNLTAEHDETPLNITAGDYVYFIQETEPEDDEETKILALIQHLDDDTDLDDVDECSHTPNLFEAAGITEYLVLTDEEADEAAQEQIEQSLWAFNAEFLWSYMPEGMDVETIQAIQEACYEAANESFRAMIGDKFQSFVNDAIASDGRGHFLSQYDGEENENDAATLFIYRVN